MLNDQLYLYLTLNTLNIAELQNWANVRHLGSFFGEGLHVSSTRLRKRLQESGLRLRTVLDLGREGTASPPRLAAVYVLVVKAVTLPVPDSRHVLHLRLTTCIATF